MIGLIAIDVDGTLRTHDGIVPEGVWEAAADLRSKGVHLALCTGRTATGDALDYARQLDPQGWHIFQNGASVLNVATGQSISKPLDEPVLEELLALSKREQLPLELTSDTAYTASVLTPMIERHCHTLSLEYPPMTLQEFRSKHQAITAQWPLTNVQWERLKGQLPLPGLELHVNHYPALDIAFAMLTPQGVSKGSAIVHVAKQYGVPIERVMMVGDDTNDIPAFEVVGHSVAMGNAHQDIRALTRHTVGHVDAGGLKEAFALALALE